MFASCSGSRFVFLAAMQAFIDRGEEGSRVVRRGKKTGAGKAKDLWGGRVGCRRRTWPCLEPLHRARMSIFFAIFVVVNEWSLDYLCRKSRWLGVSVPLLGHQSAIVVGGVGPKT